jgi:5'-nucleotidase
MSKIRSPFTAVLGLGLLATGVGYTSQTASAEPIVEIQILATNDFHGRLVNNTGSASEAGAAVLSGAVKQLRAANPNTVFAAAGDLIGASTFESFIANDKPTIDALNEAGLEVSAVGNHELDQGYDDLVDRVMAPFDATTNPEGGAEWEYIAANLDDDALGDNIAESWTQTFNAGDPDEVTVGFVGAVTEELPSLVSPDGIAGLIIEDIVDTTNAEADALVAGGADIVILLVHEGAVTTNIASATDDTTAFGRIVNGVNANVDAIVSGHTHLAYNHAIPVPEWQTEGRVVTSRPVVSAGQYGTNLNQLLFSVDAADGSVDGVTQNLLALKSPANPQTDPATFPPNFPSDAATEVIVAAAVANAEVLGSVPLGQIAGPFNRAKLANGTTENRGGESTISNLVAEVQRWATDLPETGEAEIAFMNPGGLRADMLGIQPGGYPATLTFKQAAVVQPFANTLVNMQLTGANIKLALEQQWQPTGSSRPFLRLGASEGFTHTYDPTAPVGQRITGMWLDGVAIDLAASYSVTVNSFLAAGGDNFPAFRNGTDKADTGKSDLTAMVDYVAEFGEAPDAVAVPTEQRAVGIDFPAGAPAEYWPSATVAFQVSSLAMSTAADLKDTQLTVRLGTTTLGIFPIDNTVGTEVFDEIGKASVSVVLPENAPLGEHTLMLTGNNTGTVSEVTITVGPTPSAVSLTPARLLETRNVEGFTTTDGDFEGGGRLVAGQVLMLDVAGRGGVPTNAESVFLNVTAISPSADGFITVFPCNTARPNASNVNYFTGQIVPNAVLAKLDPNGRVCLYTLSATDVVVDVNGYVPLGGALQGVAPVRLTDTRPGPDNGAFDNQDVDGRIAAGGTLEVVVAGRGGVPADAEAVLLNVTAVYPSADGFITAYECGTTVPTASNVNFRSGAVSPNSVVAKVGDDGKVCLYSLAATDIVVDLSGYVPAGADITALTPARLLETRDVPGFTTVDGANRGVGRVAAGAVYTLQVTGRGGVPSGASAAFLNVTAVDPSAPGFIMVFDCDQPRPENASNVNYLAGQVSPNAVFANVSSAGTVCLYTLAETDIVVDVNAFIP